MSELSPEALALLERARRSHGPTEHERERVLGTLHASLGIAVPLALTASLAEAATASSSAAEAAGALQSVGQLGAQNAAVHAGAAQTAAVLQGGLTAGKPGMLSLGAKLLTWKAAKVLLATVALGSVVGVGASKLPRTVERDSSQDRAARSLARGRAVEETGAAPERSVNTPSGAAAALSAQSPTTARAVAPGAAAAPGAAVAPAAAVAAAAAPSSATLAPGATPASSAVVAPAAALAPATSHASGAADRALRSRATANASPESPQVPVLRTRSSSARRAARHAQHQASHAASLALAPARAAKEPAPPPPAVPPPSATESASTASATATPTQPAPELSLIRQALTSLRDHDAARALAFLEEHKARYPNGSFVTESQGLHVIALCAAGRLEEGRSEQTAFLSKASAAPIAARVRRACTEPKK